MAGGKKKKNKTHWTKTDAVQGVTGNENAQFGSRNSEERAKNAGMIQKRDRKNRGVEGRGKLIRLRKLL